MVKTYIINVSTNEQRRNHMLRLVREHACLSNYQFVHDGDIAAISEATFVQHFGGKHKSINGAVSCAYKHILAYRDMLKSENAAYFLVLEDDIFLHEHFCERLQKIIDEIKQRKLCNFLVSLEESSLEYVKGSELRKNILLYQKNHGRMTGAYLVDRQAASNMLAEIDQNKCNEPIDWFHNNCAVNKLISIYWAQPTVAVQGSLNGQLESLIDQKDSGKLKIVQFKVNRFYKRILYRFR
jgi:glycosyl transferase family 25